MTLLKQGTIAQMSGRGFMTLTGKYGNVGVLAGYRQPQYSTPTSKRNFSIILNSDGSGGTDGGADGSEAAAKASAKEFLKAVEEDLIIDEITSTEQWTTKVMQCTDKPIILDFYADWCAPCKKLTPVLEKLTQDNEGKFKLVKVNIDNLPKLATALQVRSIPTLFLIYRGNVMDQMTGVDETKLTELVKTAILIEQAQHDESIMETVL